MAKLYTLEEAKKILEEPQPKVEEGPKYCTGRGPRKDNCPCPFCNDETWMKIFSLKGSKGVGCGC